MSSQSPVAPMTNRQQQLVWFLRILGALDMLAVGAVFLPYSGMNWMHQLIGLGDMPVDPLTGYLARSASMLYAFLGALVLYMSFDVERYRPVLTVLARIILVCGVLLFGVDLAERLPIWWVCLEGPSVLVLGGVLVWLLSSSRPESGA